MANASQFKEIKLTPEQKMWAYVKFEKWKKGRNFNENFSSPGNIYTGYLAEAAFWSYFINAVHYDTGPFDFRYSCLAAELDKWEIKAYRSHHDPGEFHGCCVTLKDYESRGGEANYLWATVNYEFTRVWLLGWLTFESFTERSRVWKKGEVKERPHFVYPESCREVLAKLINPLPTPISPAILMAKMTQEEWGHANGGKFLILEEYKRLCQKPIIQLTSEESQYLLETRIKYAKITSDSFDSAGNFRPGGAERGDV